MRPPTRALARLAALLPALLAPAAHAGLWVANFDQPHNGAVSVDATIGHAQGFSTGGEPDGYPLDAIALRFVSRSPAPAPTVTLRAGGPAGAALATLAGPRTVGGGNGPAVARYAAPPGTRLDPDSEYFVAVAANRTGAQLAFTNAPAEDAGSAAGWRIHDQGHYRVAGGAFVADASVKIIRIEGPVPEPPVEVKPPPPPRPADGTASFEVDDGGYARIRVPSAADRYHVLHYRPTGDGETEHAVAVRRGQAGEAVLHERQRAAEGGAYRVATHEVDSPYDTDGDGVDDLAELARAEPTQRAPFNPAVAIDADLGAVSVPDMAAFQALSYQGLEGESFLHGVEYIKFIVRRPYDPARQELYFMNSNRFHTHRAFWEAVMQRHGLPWLNYYSYLHGNLVYHPNVRAPNGEAGTFRYFFHGPHTFDGIAMAHELLAANMPFLRGNLVYSPVWGHTVRNYEREKARYDASRIPVYLEADIFGRSVFRPLNAAVGYGLLRVVGSGERPTAREVAILRRLPNELPAVAGVVSLERQTPLSHVNLRAVQDGVPNAYLGNALDDPAVAGLVGRYVRYEVSADPERRFAWTGPGTGGRIERAGFSITEATAEEVAEHHAARRPSEAQAPPRDLSATAPRDLDHIAFADSDAFGAKAANVAELRTLGLADVEVPDGHALPFHFYDAFMRHNGFYADVDALLADAGFRASIATRDAALAKLRRRIENGAVPDSMATELAAVQASFPPGTPIRCRSSANNEDLANFSGAGLYGSVTHHPREGHLSKSVRQVYASLWNLRAFEEREFHRVDHKAAAMGVLMHPNFSDERVNGVAVSADPLYGTEDAYYVNAQVGEELVTNPSANAVPEELLLSATGAFTSTLVSRSNLVADGGRVLPDAHAATLRTALRAIHARFRTLHGAGEGEAFAMEVEFKVTAEGQLAIKQARPWVH